MILIVSSLSLLWFGHARVSGPPIAPAPCATVTLLVDRKRNPSGPLVDDIVGEAAEIWRPLGIALQSRDGADGESPAAIGLVVDDSEVAGRSGTESLGWIRFGATGVPEPVVHVSRAAAIRLLDETVSNRELPQRYHDELLARMLGRALAHELGHYLLASTHHTAHGLMRSTLPLDVLTASERVGFGLSLDDISELQESHRGAGAPRAPVAARSDPGGLEIEGGDC